MLLVKNVGGLLSSVVVVSTLFSATQALAVGPDVLRIKGDIARAQFGNGTVNGIGLVVGVIDSGVNFSHPFLSTPGRVVAQANFVTTEPANTGADVVGHGTWVSSVLGSDDATQFGAASGARFINARALDSFNNFNTDFWIVNGAGFALDPGQGRSGSDILNFSLGYSGGARDGNTYLSRMADYISFARNVPVVVSAGNSGGSNDPVPRGPGDAFNVFSAAATDSTYDRIVNFSNFGPTSDGRNMPNLAAPGTSVAAANHNYTPINGQPLTVNVNGTSFAAPNITGILTTQIGFGRTNGLSTDPLVLRATSINSSEKIRDRFNSTWAPASSSNVGGVFTVTSPLNSSAGAGQIDGQQLVSQYTPGEFGPTSAQGVLPQIAWDENAIASGDFIDYSLGQLVAGTTLTATLAWERHVGWADGAFGFANGLVDSSDDFSVLNRLSNLDLQIFRNSTLIAQSISAVDTLEHLWLTNIIGGDYTLRILRSTLASLNGLNPVQGNEPFALAWASTQVPEPMALATVFGMTMVLLRRRGKSC